MSLHYKIRRVMKERMSNDRYENYINDITTEIENDPDVKGNFEVSSEYAEVEAHGKHYHYNVDIYVKDLKGEHKLRSQKRKDALDAIVRSRLLEACKAARWNQYPWEAMDQDGVIFEGVDAAAPRDRLTTLFPNGDPIHEVSYTLQREKQRRTKETAIPKIIEFWQDKLKERGLIGECAASKAREFNGSWLENLELVIKSENVSINKELLDNFIGELCSSNRWGANPYVVVDLDAGIGVDINEIPVENEDDDNDDELFKKYKSIIPFDVAATWQDLEECLPELTKIVNMTDEEIENYPIFDGVFGLGSQIRVMVDTLIYAIKTHGKVRNHICCAGPPGTGKTTLITHFRKLVPDNAVVVINAETATGAGFRKVFLKILSRTGVPPIMVCEEIEKPANPDTFAPFLSVFDQRATMQQLNAREAGSVEAPVLGIVTVNNIKKFKDMLSGALSSRITNNLYVPMPSDATIRRILAREVQDNGLNQEWVDAAMFVAKELYDRYKIPKDARAVKGYLIGGDRLLDGSFMRDQLVIHQMEVEQNINGDGAISSDQASKAVAFARAMSDLLKNPDVGD